MSEEYVYGAQVMSPRVMEVLPQPDHKLLLSFDNGEWRLFDVRPLLDMKAFEPLRSEKFFKLAGVAYGTVVWPNDIDYCPDTLYAQSVPCPHPQ